MTIIKLTQIEYYNHLLNIGLPTAEAKKVAENQFKCELKLYGDIHAETK